MATLNRIGSTLLVAVVPPPEFEDFVLLEAPEISKEVKEANQRQEDISSRLEQTVRANLEALEERKAMVNASQSPLNFTLRTVTRLLQHIAPESHKWLIDGLLREGRLVTSIATDLLVGVPEPLQLIISVVIEDYHGKIEIFCKLSGDLLCTFILTLPSSKGKPEELAPLHQALIDSLKKRMQGSSSELTLTDLQTLHALASGSIKDKLSEKLKEAEKKPAASLEEVIQLLLSIPSQDGRLQWTNKLSGGTAELELGLPGDAKLKMTFRSTLNLRQAVNQPPLIIKRLFPDDWQKLIRMVEALLEHNLDLRWSGSLQKLNLDFTRQILVVNRVKLKAEGVIAGVAESIAKGIKIHLPERIEGTVVFARPAISFNKTPFKATIDRPFVPKFDALVKDLAYDPKKKSIDIAYQISWGLIKKDAIVSIDLTTSMVESIDFHFEKP